MCVNKKWITNPVTKQRVLVDCGKCPACQQAKANKRTQRVYLQSKIDVPVGNVTMFVTLTYDNKHIPFIKQQDYYDFIYRKSDYLPVYRSVQRPIGRSAKRRIWDNVVLCSYENASFKHPKSKLNVSSNFADNFRLEHDVLPLPTIRYVRYRGSHSYFDYDTSRVAVLYYKDVQDFIKNLKIYLLRHYGLKELPFFCVGEYGPRSHRSHYHLLLHVPSQMYKVVENAVASLWKYDNIRKPAQRKRQIQLVENAASYVSSYVNCSADFPDFFRCFRPFSPLHVYSHGYGMASKYCDISYLETCVSRSRFYYLREITKDGIKSVVKMPLPSYVINRYFPKFKGYSRLTDYEIVELIKNPARFCEYKKTLEYEEEDFHKIAVSIDNHYKRWCSIKNLPVNGYNLDVYANNFVQTWRSYMSFLHYLGWQDVRSYDDIVYHFYNWKDYVYKDSDFFEYLGFITSYYDNFESDPNKFPSVVARTSQLEVLYDLYDKSKRVKNDIYSLTSNV